jgi:required for meiotic nuclear division protein 1
MNSLQMENKTVRALLVSDRIDTAQLERKDLVATNPLTFPVGISGGKAVVFRYGVVVFIDANAAEQESVLQNIRRHSTGTIKRQEEETAIIELAPDKDEQIPPGGPIVLKMLTPERAILVAEALAKSVVLARDEHEVAGVFDLIEPFVRKLATTGETPGGRRTILKHIGNALLVQQRVSGRAAIAEKPDVLWDRPGLERLYAKLEDEYEIQERAHALNRKLAVIAESAQALTDLIDTRRSLRLEIAIVALITLEIAFTIYQIASNR